MQSNKEVKPIYFGSPVIQKYITDTTRVNSTIDSLKIIFLSTECDTLRIQLLNQLAEEWVRVNPEIALTLAEELISCSENLANPFGIRSGWNMKGIYFQHSAKNDSALFYYFKNSEPINGVAGSTIQANAYNGIASIYRLIGKMTEALPFLDKSISILEKNQSLLQSNNQKSNIQLIVIQKGIAQALETVGLIQFNKGDQKAGLENFNRSLNIRRQIFDHIGIASALNSIGMYHFYLGDNALALEYYQKSLKIREAMGDQKGMVSSLNNIAIIYNRQGDISSALENYYKGLKIQEKVGDKRTISFLLFNIGNIYANLSDFPKAIDYYTKSLQLREEINDKKSIASSLVSIAIVYNSLGENAKALIYFEKGLSINREIADRRGVSLVLHNIGKLYLDESVRFSKTNKPDSAEIMLSKSLNFFLESLKLQEELVDKNGIAASLSNIGEIYFKQGNIEKAHDYANRAYRISKDLGFPDRILSASRILNDIYRKKGNYLKALEYNDEFYTMRDSLNNIENQKELEKKHWQHTYEKQSLADSLQHAQAIQAKNFELEKKQEEWKRQRIALWALIAVFIMVIALALLTYRSYRIKLKTNKIVSEKNTMLEQAYEEIKTTLDTLAVKNEKLVEQHKEIERQRNSLSEMNAELQNINEEIRAQKEELERTQKQLVQSEKMASIGVLTAGIAHEINNPINFVYAGVNNLKRDFSDIEKVLRIIRDIENKPQKPDEIVTKIIQTKNEFDFDEAFKAIAETMSDVQNGAERTAKIVEGLREFSRSETDQFDSTNINRVIEGILLLLKNKYEGRIEIVKVFDPQLPLVECKVGKINQVIMNLVTNAIDAIMGTGTIEISTRLVANNCTITVKDNGIGIPEEDFPKIFDPFFTTKDVGKGIGLGLSITYAIVEEHGGSIDAKSKQGEGTEFSVTIPVKQ
jgi:signal transduction histidine kinase